MIMDNNNPRDVERTDYIKPYAIVKLGEKVASTIADGYNSASAEEKLSSAIAIIALPEEELSSAAKVKFVGDIMTRPKKERLKIGAKLLYLLFQQPLEKHIPED